MDVKIKKARDVLILSTADWDNPSWTNKQHMAVQFAQHGWRVFMSILWDCVVLY